MISVGRCALVLGASGGLGSAMVSEFLNDPEIDKVFAVSSKKILLARTRVKTNQSWCGCRLSIVKLKWLTQSVS